MIAERVATPRLSLRGQSLAGAVLVGAVALARADAGLVGALAPDLRRSLGLDDTQIGLLASLASVTGALSALPGGLLVDRRSRRAVLAAALLIWSLALGVAGLAAGFALLAVGRLVSGATSSVARPGAVSLIGDAYGLEVRTRALARLDATEAAGAAACYLAAAAAVAIGDWRLAFFGLGAAGLLLALGARHLPAVRAGAGAAVEPARSVLTVLRIRTNLVALTSDSIGNFFYAGATSFGVLMVTERYGLSTATVDALAPAFGIALIGGILLGGRLGDHLAGSTRGSRRLVVAAAGNTAAATAMLPALLGTSIIASAALLALAAGLLGVARPCLDAVRVDIMPPTWRGRAEAARGLLTLGSSAAGPLVFGAVASTLGGRAGHGLGLDHAFLIMLAPLAAGGVILLTALRTYERDAEAAGALPTPRAAGAPPPGGAEGVVGRP